MRDLRKISERTPAKNIAGEILTLIGTGGTRIKRKEISHRLTISERVVRANIAYLNDNSYPIISAGNGFFYAQSASDFDIAIQRLNAEEENIRQRKNNLERMKREFLSRESGGGQLTLLEGL